MAATMKSKGTTANEGRSLTKEVASLAKEASTPSKEVRSASNKSASASAGAANKSTAASKLTKAQKERVERLLGENYAFMDSPSFKRRGLERELFGQEDSEPELPPTSWYQPTSQDLLEVDTTHSPKLMSASEEKLMFLRFNYAKRKLGQLQAKAKKDGLSKELADEVLLWHRRFEHYREYLVRTNLALVLAMAKRTRLGHVDFAEIVSEGNMALLRAVEKFNVERGFKFSTYACRAILKAFSRAAMKASKHRTRFPVEFEPDLEKSDWSDRKRETIEADCVDELKVIVDRNLADLSSVEQTVIRRRFNWQEQNESPLTLEEVGKIIGVTKERVRQIQNKALLKIKQVMEDGVLRTKTEQQNAEEQAKASVESVPALASQNVTSVVGSGPVGSPQA